MGDKWVRRMRNISIIAVVQSRGGGNVRHRASCRELPGIYVRTYSLIFVETVLRIESRQFGRRILAPILRDPGAVDPRCDVFPDLSQKTADT